MDLVETLKPSSAEIIEQASQALERSHLPHYERAGGDIDRQRLQDLFDVVIACLERRELAPVTDYAEAIASKRHDAGYGIGEVKTAFNVLEEAMWRTIVAATPPDQLAEPIGLLATVLGAGKDALACAYVSLATRQHVPSLDLRALFEGT
jgi:hypothetical protein